MTAPSQPDPLFVGVDGGGTGCRARIEDAKGCLLGTGIAGPAALRVAHPQPLDRHSRGRIHGRAGLGRRFAAAAVAVFMVRTKPAVEHAHIAELAA